ncbi:hypothetical protein L0664_06185 [Octadecabacter sp. G9-8]|uniref:ABC transmembrane type-1 domain-containing protein n=1 Tax=Octadecabacter dasysiphoniae TaxID=2909341 RepID=A0ABS9CX71_9RHOB|nr:ABC transporter transmembrane domain-containing protein [Octadecabacter dasysiphoniae]MCF2870648.1 hypothetical protein [Octadecabacter dasysiphoniae]
MKPIPQMATEDRVKDAILIISCGIAQAAALAVAAFATRDAFAAIHTGTPLESATIFELAVSGLVAAACLFLSRRRAEALGQSYANSLRKVLYLQIARLPKLRHEERRVGALSLRFVGDLSAARLWFGRGLPEVLTALVVLPSAIAILFALDPDLARTGLVPLGIAVSIMGIMSWHLERRHRQLRQRRASIAISMIERIAIAPELDLMGRTDKELRALDSRSAALRHSAVQRRGRTAGLQAILQAGVAMSGLSLLWFANGHAVAPATVAASLSVLALVALPLGSLASAWDQYCAWRVAREKAQNLLNERPLSRRSSSSREPVSVDVTGLQGGHPVAFRAAAGSVAKLEGPAAAVVARCISGLDLLADVEVSFDGSATTRPRIAHIGSEHVGLQGSLRRSVTMMCRTRPSDAKIENVLGDFGLADLLRHPKWLDQRVFAGGKGLSEMQTLRVDFARAVLGKVDLIVISSIRWKADPDQQGLLTTLRRLTPATVILADAYTKTQHTEAL